MHPLRSTVINDYYVSDYAAFVLVGTTINLNKPSYHVHIQSLSYGEICKQLREGTFDFEIMRAESDSYYAKQREANHPTSFYASI